MFAIAIGVSFIMIRNNVDTKGLNLLGIEVKLTACADYTTLFWRTRSSLKVLLQTFEKFERVSSLKPGGEGIPILGHTRDVRQEWVSFRGPKTCGWV